MNILGIYLIILINLVSLFGCVAAIIWVILGGDKMTLICIGFGFSTFIQGHDLLRRKLDARCNS